MSSKKANLCWRRKGHMKTVAGVFTSRAKAERVADRLTWIGLPRDRAVVLSPGQARSEVESEVRVDSTEQPGMGTTLGAVVGTAAGTATGIELGAAATAIV